ncbi:MAG: hypothetical protein ACI4Q8_00155 [Ruminococcus sp.]
MKLLKNIKFQKFLYICLSLLLAFCLVAVSVFTLLECTIFNQSYLGEVLNNSDYYIDLCDEIQVDLVDIGNASGLDKKFFDDFVDEVMVREDVQNYLDMFYSGQKPKVDTKNFERSLRSAIEKYEVKQGIDPENVSEESIEYFISEAAKIYSKNIKITYFDAIQKDFMKWSKRILIFDLIFAGIGIGLAVVIFFTNKWKHKAIRYIYYSTAATGLFLIIIPIAVYFSDIISKIAILSRSLNDMYISCLNNIFINISIVAVIFLVVSAVLIVIHNHLRKKST